MPGVLHRRWVPRGLVVVLLLLGAGAPAVRAEQEDVEARWSALVGEVTHRWHALAAWCKDRQLYSCRADAYEALLPFSPDDGAARKALGYARDGTGEWRRDPKYKPIRNQAKGADEYATRLEALRSWFGQSARALIEEGTRSVPRRSSVWLASALTLAPDSDVLRTINGEVREIAGATSGGAEPARRWILAESQRARTRRFALHHAMRDAVARVPEPKPGSIEDVDRHGALAWPHLLQFDSLRVLGFAPRSELVLAGRYVEAVGPLLRETLGIESWEDYSEPLSRGRSRTLYVFTDRTAAMGWLRKQPNVDARFLEFVAHMAGAPLPDRAASMVMSPEPASRLEAAPRLVLGRAIHHKTHLTSRQAWLGEGLTIYLTWLITGTRLILSADDVEPRYAEARPPLPRHVERMVDPTSDWLELARELFDSAQKPDPFLLLGKDVNELTPPEVLYGHAVAAWAIEGQADKALRFFQGLGSDGGTDLDAVCLKVLGYDARTMEARVKRWLTETTGAGTVR